jgi:hypothetical protein
MSHARSLFALASFAGAALAFAGCGGGGSGGNETAGGSIALHGQVMERDGSTSSLGGVWITDERTGETVVTGPDGSFDFGAAPAGSVQISVYDPLAPLALETGGDGGGDVDVDPPAGDGDGVSDGDGETEFEHDACDDGDAPDGDGEPASGDGDGADVGDRDADFGHTLDGEVVVLRLYIRRGLIERLEVAHSEHDGRRVDVRLERAETSDDPDVVGGAGLLADECHQAFRVVAENLAPGREVVLVLHRPGGDSQSQGGKVADDHGRAAWVADTSLGDALPFGVGSVADLLGVEIVVRGVPEGPVLLVGAFPTLPPPADEPESTEAHGRALLENADGVVGEAHVGILHRTGEEPREVIAFDVEGMTAGLGVQAWIQDPEHPDAFVQILAFTLGEHGGGEAALNTAHGDVLPFGVDGVAALVGLHVQIRRASDGAVLFRGVVPPLVFGD